jgi:phage gp29-like protein
MSPVIALGEKGGQGIIEQLAYGYFAGHQVIEIRWEGREIGIVPRAGKVVPPRFYGYPYDDRDEDKEDRLMFNPEGGLMGYDYVDFPEHKFLLAINGGHPGHPTVAAPLRALTGYWLAAVYGLKWLMDFSQKFGIPFRWATFADPNDKSLVAQMMQQIGSGGWGVFPQGTKLELHDATKAASAVPQKELIEMADRQCDTFILGQTLTTDVGDSGSRALGDVHQGVRMDVMQGVTDFVADILNEQFLPSLIELNYGEASEVPTISAKFEKPKDEEAMARRDKELFVSLGLPVEKSWLYERHAVPVPDPESDDLFQPGSHGAQGEPATEGEKPPEEEPSHETKARLEASDNRTQSAISTIDQLSANVLEDLTGVTKEWLGPVRPFFERLAALAMSKNVTDEDFADALEKAQRELPELFDRLNVGVLEDSLHKAIGTAMIAGSVQRYERREDA